MADIQKTYQYQVFKSITFLGVLQNVSSEFSYSQDINSNAVTLNVVVGLSADVADIPVTAILDEAGNPILDEDGNTIYEERSPDVVGSFNPYALIQEDNILKVYEISSDNPNGVLVFDGYIENWAAKLGGADEKISFTAVSKGVDLVDYIIEGVSTTDQSQTTGASTLSIYFDNGTGAYQYAGQTFTVGAGVTSISSISVKLATATSSSQQVTVSLSNDVFGTPVGNVSRTVQGTTPAVYTFTFANAITLVPGAVMSLAVYSYTVPIAIPVSVYYNSGGGLYAGGSGYVATYAGGGGGGWGAISPAGSNLYFTTNYNSGATSSPFTSTDPTTILTNIITAYNSGGGIVTTTANSVAATGLSTSYTFKVNTTLEGVKKCLDLAPADWYWYVNPATSVLYFLETATTATHRFIKGRHFSEIDIGGTVENVRNVVYFTGGLIGTTNLFQKFTNTTSLALRRRRLASLVDNRVTVAATASLIANNYLTENANTVYNVPLTILDGKYNIGSINVGDTVQLSGFGNFADTLLLQVARLVRYPDRVDLTLGVILKRQGDALLEALSAIDKLNTVANPTAPS